MADGHSEGGLHWHVPVTLAGLRVERLHGVSVPDDQLPPAAQRVDDRRAIARLPTGQCPPQFLARTFVKRDARGAPAAHHADQPVAIHQRMRRGAPFRNGQPIGLFKILMPNRLAILGSKTKKMPLGAQRIHVAILHCGRGTRADGIGGHCRVRTIPLARPQHAPGRFLQAYQPFLAGK